MLELAGLNSFYGTSHVLFGVDFTLGNGEIAALIGRNGMGKTTTVRSIMGIVRPRSGVIRFHGKEIQHYSSYQIARQGIGLVPEGRRIFSNLSVRENLIAMSGNRRRVADPWTLEKIYELFPGVADRRNSMGSHLSGGEQQMLAIGRALMTNPELLILDEATEGLAPKIRDVIWNCIWKLRGMKQSILVIDRNTDALLKVADRFLIMEKGRVIWNGSTTEFRAQRTSLERHLSVTALTADTQDSI